MGDDAGSERALGLLLLIFRFWGFGSFFCPPVVVRWGEGGMGGGKRPEGVS